MGEARAARSKAARRELSEIVFHTMRQHFGERAHVPSWPSAAAGADEREPAVPSAAAPPPPARG
jgi:hypothetical protein